MFQPGQDFAHFTIVRLLGEGGMGQVYLAEDQKLHRQVALKILTWQHGESEERHARFEREARTAAQVSHPNVMAIYDIDSVTNAAGEDITYIVMEYVKGKPLTEYMRPRQDDIAAAVRLAEKIASGLAAAHKMNVVHRDIKADNILVDEDDQPKILDFGLAKPVEPVQFSGGETGTKTISKELTRAGKIIGTVSYMSPEQIRGEQVDTRSDIFSFGILFYRMITGEFPFSGPTEVSTLAKILEGRHEPLRVRNENIPTELERIVDKCLQKDANDRYQDTRDLVVDLRNLRRQYDSGVSDRISAITDKPARVPKTRRLNLSWKATVLLLFIAVLVFAYFADRGEDGASEVVAKGNNLAVLEFENRTNDKDLDWLQNGLPEILLTDLAQHPGINLISRQRITETLQEYSRKGEAVEQSELRRVAAEELGASTVLSGAYYKVGNQIRIDARLEDATSGRIILAEKVVGEDPFSLVDSLTTKIASSLNAGRGANGTDVASITSSSPEAYKQYILGMEQFSKGLYDESIVTFKKAVALDSTFALPYMRIGMANAFQGHPQVAAQYLALAVKHQTHLPVREKTLLDIYADIWLNKKFGDAFAKMKAMVSTFPDDIEARTIYAILINEFTHDTTAAFAQLDTVHQLNPTYQFSQEYRAGQYLNKGILDEAIQLGNDLKEHHPDAPGPYNLLATAYLRQGRRDQAAMEYKELLTKFPKQSRMALNLYRVNIYNRDFAGARQALEQMRDADPENLYNQVDYYDGLANLAMWQGKFNDALSLYRQELQAALKTKDSSIIANTYESIGSINVELGRPAEGLALSKEGYRYRTVNMFPNYILLLVEVDRKNADKARPMFREGIGNFKARIPSELWPIADGLELIFEGNCAADTAKIIEGLRVLIKAQPDQGKGNIRQLAEYLVATGQYDEGIKLLEGFIHGPDESTTGLSYYKMLYYLGLGYEGLGQKEKAAGYYREMLAGWATADFEIKEIANAKSRLAKLTS